MDIANLTAALAGSVATEGFMNAASPGVLDTTTNFVEHPDLIAERIERFTNIVGKERVIAGTDGGFGIFAGFGAVHPDIAYAKLGSLAEGARRISEKLWG
jgi:5-methyltetrahydropteroyltriglutamate--homocysteine methyltransferase